MGDYFIRIDDATELRRKTLESSKASINILREHNKLLRIRKAKLQLIQSLRRELKDLTSLMNRLEGTVPRLTKSEVQELNPNLPSLGTKKSGKKTKKKSSKKPKKEKPVDEPESDDVYIGKPEPKKPKPVQKEETWESEEQPVKEPKSKEELLREKLSDIERKLQRL